MSCNAQSSFANDPLVRRQDINRVLPVSFPTLKRMIDAGEFPAPAMYRGHVRYWRSSDIERWQNGRRSGWKSAQSHRQTKAKQPAQ